MVTIQLDDVILDTTAKAVLQSSTWDFFVHFSLKDASSRFAAKYLQEALQLPRFEKEVSKYAFFHRCI